MKFKIFFGCNEQFKKDELVLADDLANKWLAEHPNITIVHIDYKHTRYGNHSICIAYTEEENAAK